MVLLASRAVFGVTVKKFGDCQKGERGSFDGGQKAQLVFRLCGRLR